ncbi:hypothetical protein GH733_013734, partial [Mirounga leonina]
MGHLSHQQINIRYIQHWQFRIYSFTREKKKKEEEITSKDIASGKDLLIHHPPNHEKNILFHRRAPKNFQCREKNVSTIVVPGEIYRRKMLKCRWVMELLFSKSVTLGEYWDKGNLKWSLRLQTRKWKLSGQREAGSSPMKLLRWGIPSQQGTLRSETGGHNGLKQLYDANNFNIKLAMPMAIASSVTSGHRCVRTHSYVELTLYGKLRREIFELKKESYILKIHFGVLNADQAWQISSQRSNSSQSCDANEDGVVVMTYTCTECCTLFAVGSWGKHLCNLSSFPVAPGHISHPSSEEDESIISSRGMLWEKQIPRRSSPFHRACDCPMSTVNNMAARKGSALGTRGTCQ